MKMNSHNKYKIQKKLLLQNNPSKYTESLPEQLWPVNDWFDNNTDLFSCKRYVTHTCFWEVIKYAENKQQ